ncbi:putative RRP12-like protein isoform X1 [Apostichopus japonicus]|uniref:Putative RRP12-like protein isoform X1 n=1 Tax=Stichopus japonicus TaxID=307972 RepID=A0A2G8JW83_STIJA|nr:putative RRP12-like protein isoform X1 [Apostichopus japonicus]
MKFISLHDYIVCAVLAAITEVIRDQGGKETETEYFGALMTAMETMETEESLTAVTFLLSLIIKRVPPPVLKLKFSEVSKSLSGLLASHSSGNNTALVKSILSCFGNLLRSQEASAWSNPSTLNTYQGILSFTTHSKPKVRKAAQSAVVSILMGSSFTLGGISSSTHPAAQATAKFCIQQVEKHGGSGEATATCHILTLLQSVISSFPKSALKETCETILKVMTLSNVVVSAVAMKALHSLVSMDTSLDNFPPELNAKLINALYDFQPSTNDSQPSQAWLAVMQAAHVNLFRSNQTLCLNHLHRLFQVCMAYLLSEKGEIAVASANAMKAVLKECVGSLSDDVSGQTKEQNPVMKIFSHVEGGLSYQYHASWGLVLQTLSVFFEVWGKAGHQYMHKCLQTMCDLRSTHHFAFINEVDKCIGEAIKTMGPRIVLDAVPFQITGEEDNYDFPRSWLVPVIRDNVCNTELQFFTKFFLPLAAKFKIKSLELKQNNREVEAKTYDVLQVQLWSLFPGFCKSPTDVIPAFKGIAKILGSALGDRKDVRSDICSGLRNIIKSNVDNERNKTELARFAKNFLPILFNIFTKENSEGNRSVLAVLETIKIFLQITDVKLVDDLVTRVCGKFSSGEESQQPPLLDLLIALAPYASSGKLSQIFQEVSPCFESTNHSLQKKSYRVLEEICSGQSDACSKFREDNIELLEKKLVESMSSAASPSKLPRLRCLLHIVKQLPSGKHDVLKTILPEVILCAKEVNSKTRSTAFLLLSEIGRCLLRSDEKSKQESIAQYLSMLAAGLAGSSQMISATILAFTSVIYEFKDLIDGMILGQLLESVHTLIASKTRDILRPALGLTKVICAVTEDTSLAQYVQPLLEDLGNLSDTNSRALRVSIKSIFKQLMKKFGYEMLSKMVAGKQLKMLHNVKKRQDRNKRLRTAKEQIEDDEDDNEMAALMPSKPKPESMEQILQETDSEDDDDDEDEDKRSKTKVKRSRKTARGSTWLKEDDNDEPMDFLDPTVSKRVLATKPRNEAGGVHRGIPHDFKKLPDGRLVITEPKDDEDEKPSSGGRKRKMEPDDDLEAMMDQELLSRKKMKKKWNDMDSSDDEDEVGSKYQAGGKGIHRVLPGQKKPKVVGIDYKSKKAGGDIKRKGKPDPFAYLPMSRKQLNRRKKKQTSGTWKQIAKTGHRKGSGGADKEQKSKGGRGGQKNKRHKKH